MSVSTTNKTIFGTLSQGNRKLTVQDNKGIHFVQPKQKLCKQQLSALARREYNIILRFGKVQMAAMSKYGYKINFMTS